MSTTRPRAQAPGIFISYCATAMRTTTIGNNKRQVSDGEASCASTQHIHIVSRDGDKDDEVKRTCYASNIDATTSQATSNLDAHEPMSHIVIHRRPRARAHQAFICNKPLSASAHGFQPSCASARATFRTVYCRLTTTTHNYAGNKPLCASAHGFQPSCASARAKRQT